MSTILYDYPRRAVAWPLAVGEGLDRVETRLRLRLLSERGSWPGDTTIGLPLSRWQERRPTVESVVSLVRAQAQAVEGVRVVSVSATVGQTIAISMDLAITLPTGETDASVVADLYGADAVASWYMTGGRVC